MSLLFVSKYNVIPAARDAKNPYISTSLMTRDSCIDINKSYVCPSCINTIPSSSIYPGYVNLYIC